MLFIPDPSLAFLGVPQRVVPFPIAEAQSATLARWWSNRLALPTKEEMTMWEEQEIQKRDCDVSSLHDLRYPRDVAYINRLHDLSSKAAPLHGLEREGHGREAPYWDEEKAWVRERFPAIKEASQKLGMKRVEVKRLEELGFDFKAWKQEKN